MLYKQRRNDLISREIFWTSFNKFIKKNTIIECDNEDYSSIEDDNY